MHFLDQLPSGGAAFGLLVLMCCANELGYRIGRRRHASESDRMQIVSSAIKGSVIGLVALLIGFSFAMTTTRFNERQRIVLDEANSIGTCYLRAGLLAEPARHLIRDPLARYTAARIEYFEKGLDPEAFLRTTQAMDGAVKDLWNAVQAAVEADRQAALVSQIVPAANEVIDLSATRAWASEIQTPRPLLLLLALCAIISSGMLGHSSGQVAIRHFGLWTALNVLIGLVVFVIIDFDRPRRGLIQVNHSPMYELQKCLEAP